MEFDYSPEAMLATLDEIIEAFLVHPVYGKDPDFLHYLRETFTNPEDLAILTAIVKYVHQLKDRQAEDATSSHSPS